MSYAVKMGTFNNETDKKKPHGRKLHHPPQSKVTHVSTGHNTKRCVGCLGLRTTSYPICTTCSQKNRK